MSDALYSAVASKTFAAVGADIELMSTTHGPGRPCRRIRVGGAGNLRLVYTNKADDTITGLTAGDVLDVQAVRIVATGTTATQITVFW